MDDDGGADGQGVLLALIRRWKWVVAGAFLGVVVAGLLVVVLPKQYTATGDVLLHDVEGDNAAQVSRMQTAAELAHSIPVAERALQELGTGGDAEKLLERYSVSPLTNELLHVEARAPTPELAVQRVTAVVGAYLDYLADEGDQELATIERTIETRATALQAQISQLDGQIAGFGVPGEVLTPEQQLLLTQRETLANELATAQATLEQARADHRLALGSVSLEQLLEGRLRDLHEERHSERVLRLADLVGGRRRDESLKEEPEPDEAGPRAII